MTAEKLIDAMHYLPEELLEQTDRLRQRRKANWKPWGALVACLCLVAGLWFINPGDKYAMDNGASPDGEYLGDDAGAGKENSLTGTTATGITVYVHQVYDDHIVVKYDISDVTADVPLITVSLAKLEQIPQLSVGQKICLYTKQEEVTDRIEPYKIIIMEE